MVLVVKLQYHRLDNDFENEPKRVCHVSSRHIHALVKILKDQHMLAPTHLLFIWEERYVIITIFPAMKVSRWVLIARGS